ncbi:MAG: hypothetical protein ACWGSD_03580 [Thermodesulfobacteriota bacterium]
MSQKKRKKKPKGTAVKQPPEARGKSSRVSWILVGLAVAVALAGIYLVFMRQGPTSGNTDRTPGPGTGRQADSAAPASVDFQVLVGKWVRPDGGYVISVRSVDPKGRVDAAYFNPRPINVSRAEASVQGKAVKLFMELQAAGYPGSTYELIYDPGNDALVGVYFQAAMQQSFEVVFLRTE